MKKQLLNVGVAFATSLFLAGGALAQHEAPIRSESVPAITDAITIDGVADEASWGPQSDITEMFTKTGITNAADFSGFIKLTWDKTNLYLFASVTDDTETDYPGTGDVYTFDCVEIFQDLDTSIVIAAGAYITGDTADQIQLRFNRGVDTATGSKPRNDVSYEFAETNSSTGWTLEVALPWVGFMPVGSVPEDINDWLSKALGFDCQIADNDGSGRDGQGMWDADGNPGVNANEDNAWKDTRVFGVITFVGLMCGECSSVKSNFIRDNIKIYPNPADKEIIIKELDGVSSIEFLNSLGQTIKNIEVNASEITLDVSDLATGIYIARFYSNKGISSERIIIK